MTQLAPLSSASPSAHLPLAGKIAFVTGGSRGIGAAIVRRLVDDGARVAFTYAGSRAHATALADDLAAHGGHAVALHADSADEAALRGAIAHAVAELGPLDILVNNAGVLALGSVEDFAVAELDRLYAINVRAAFIATQAAVATMPPGGRVIIIGSIAAAKTNFAQSSAYSMSKAAVAAMARSFAIDLAQRQITVNTVQPGPTVTDMNPADGPHIDAILSRLPLRRLGTPSEIASLVAYLATPAAAFVTGAALTIDGGYLA